MKENAATSSLGKPCRWAYWRQSPWLLLAAHIVPRGTRVRAHTYYYRQSKCSYISIPIKSCSCRYFKISRWPDLDASAQQPSFYWNPQSCLSKNLVNVSDPIDIDAYILSYLESWRRLASPFKFVNSAPNFSTSTSQFMSTSPKATDIILYKSFQEGLHDGDDGNKDILIPAKFYKPDESINSQEDLCLKILIAKKRWRKLIPSSTTVQQQPLAWLLFPNIYGTANCRRISETPQLLKV